MVNETDVVSSGGSSTPSSGRMGEVAGFVSSAMDAMTPGAVAGLAQTATNLVLLADRFATPEVTQLLDTVLEATPNLTKLVETVNQLSNSGTIDRLLELVSFVRAIQDSANAALVTTVLSQVTDLMYLADDVISSPAMTAVPGILQSLEETIEEEKHTSGSVTLRQIFKQVRDPNTLEAIHFMLAFVQKLAPALRPIEQTQK